MDHKIYQGLLSLLSSHGHIKNYYPNDIIVSKGDITDQTAFLLDGLVKVTMGKEQNALLLYHITDFDLGVISFMNIYEDTPIQTTVIAIKQTKLLWVSNQVLLDLSTNNQELKHILITSYHNNNQHLLHKINEILTLSVEDRLFEYLITKSSLFNTKKLELTRFEIASDLNISKEAVSRALKQLDDQNRISRNSRIIIIESF